MEKLNKAIKSKWVKALRSGKYEQGTHWLEKEKDEGGKTYCCLGVACEIGITRRAESGDEYAHETFLPRRTQAKLAKFNDAGWSFKWIASYIERWL
jgi:hypothetical protein